MRRDVDAKERKRVAERQRLQRKRLRDDYKADERQRDRIRKRQARARDASSAQRQRQKERERKRRQRAETDSPAVKRQRCVDTESHRRVRADLYVDERGRYDVPLGAPCEYCGAELLQQERVSEKGGKLRTPCCNDGDVDLPLPQVPDEMRPLIDDPKWPSLARKVNHRTNWVTTMVLPWVPGRRDNGFHFPADEPPCLLNLHGRVLHWATPVSAAAANLQPEQWYVTPDDDEMTDSERTTLNTFVAEVRQVLSRCNPVTDAYRRAVDLAQQNPDQAVVLQFEYGDAGPDVSALYHTSNVDRLPPLTQLMVWPHDERKPSALPVQDGMRDALAFPVLFPDGRGGYDPNSKTRRGKKVTLVMFGTYMTFQQPHHFWRSPRLAQEWLLHVWNQAENFRLQYYYNRGDMRVVQPDQARRGHEGARACFIPDGFPGGPRYYNLKLNNTLAAAAVNGVDNTVFLTFTMSPDHPSLKRVLRGQSAAERPDLVARVFESLRHLIRRDIVAGKYTPRGYKCDYFVDVVEWQKRGLPHVHVVLHFKGPIWTADQVDEMMWTHLPTEEDERRYPGLTALVKKFMIHKHTDRCIKRDKDGNVLYQKNGEPQCVWGFPQRPVARTYRDSYGRWHTWRRTEDARVSAYHPAVLLALMSHLNWQCTHGTASIGYLFKYPLKGDAKIRAAIAAANADAQGAAVDEGRIYQELRTVSASEAIFRILGFPLVVQAPAVTSVSVQLPEQERLVYNLYAKRPEHAAHDFRGSQVTVWFKRPAELEHVGFRAYFQRYVATRQRPRTGSCFLDQDGWYVHERANAEDHLVHVKPAYKVNSEQFFARLLLLQPDCLVRSWEALRTVDGVEHPTLHAAARARGLLDEHTTAVMVMSEALTSRLMTPVETRVLFVMVIANVKCDAPQLLEAFESSMLEDSWRDAPRWNLLQDLHRRLCASGGSLADYGFDLEQLRPPDPLLPPPDERWLRDDVTLADDQRAVYERVMAHVRQERPSAPLFVHVEGEAGGGKTFTLQKLLAAARSMGRLVLPAAFPAKVSRKFRGGQTVHFWFKLRSTPAGEAVELRLEEPTADAAHDSQAQAAARVLQRARLVFIDEATMLRADELDAIVQWLIELSFRGVLMLVGNSAQLQAVIQGADLATQIAFSLPQARSFERFETFRLTGQQRCRDEELRRALHDIGYGTCATVSGRSFAECPKQRVRLNRELFHAKAATDDNIAAMRRWVHGDVNARDPLEVLHGAIVCSTNDRADEHNNALLDELHGDARTYIARDEVKNINVGDQDFEGVRFTEEHSKLLNDESGARGELRLKVGAPVHVTCNLDRTEGLVNGALATVVSLQRNTVTIRLANPEHPDRAEWTLPRVTFEVKPKKLPVKVMRHQIPLRLAWASTVHRVQGDDLSRVVVDLRDEYFAHGQLYVACSRGHDRDETWFLVPERDLYENEFEVTNVVVPQMLVL